MNTQVTIKAPEQVELPALNRGFRSALKQPRFMHYNRLIALLVLLNGAAFAHGWQQGWWQGAQAALTMLDFAVVNFSVAILVRQQYVINLLFWLATRAPTSWPLKLRWTLGKVYHYGGLHKGGAMLGSLWFAGYLAVASYQQWGAISLSLSFGYALMALLLVILTLAQKTLRARFHNSFEISHRLGGWTALGLFWALAINLVQEQSALPMTEALLAESNIWLLALVTCSVVLPWLRLKRVAVDVVTPSNHVAVSQFDYGVTPFAGSSTAISTNPLLEWHHFANAPSPERDGFRLVISRAGDWTGRFIDNPPSHVWVKGIPQAGVAYIEVLFKKVVYVATGSGIGPVLPHLLAQKVPIQLIWSTREPRKTYGDALVDEILAVQPDALIWDTDSLGKPDLVALAYQAAQQFDAEAVICISNEKLTWQVVTGMERRGIPAYGAIWDS